MTTTHRLFSSARFGHIVMLALLVFGALGMAFSADAAGGDCSGGSWSQEANPWEMQMNITFVGDANRAGYQALSTVWDNVHDYGSTYLDTGGEAGCDLGSIAEVENPSGLISASPMTITSGNSSILSWVTQNVHTCSIDQGIGIITSNTEGTRTVRPTTTTTYTMTCTLNKPDGEEDKTGSRLVRTATVTVNPPAAATAILSANPTRILSGASSVLTWSSTNATSCSLNQGIGSVATSGSRSVSPTTTTTYTVSCTGAGGSASDSENVTVTVPAAPTAALTASPTSVVTGSASTLTWSSTNATSCSLNQSIGGVATSGTRAVSPTSTTAYTVTCTGAGGSANASATVTVTSRPTTSLSANPSSVVSGSASTLSWSSANALLCTGTGFDTQGATAGSVSTGALSATTAFSILCTGPAGSAVPGTWDLAQSDISDMACPITNNNNVYSGVARCPANPQGKTCSGEGSGSVCRVNTLSNEGVGGGGCYVYTDIYTCKQSSGAPTAPSATAYASVAVTPVVQQTATNLTAGAITPTTATQGTSVTLSSLITNAGTLLTPTGFTNLFQIDSDADHNAVTTTSTDTSPALAPSAGDTSQVSYTFPTVGTWYVRACADSNASWVSTITESNEADNCGPWTAVTVSSSCTGASCLPDGSILSCSASPTTITAGGSSTWSASKSGLGTYTWTPSETGTPTSGAQTLSRTYSSAGTYAMSVSAGGATASCTNSVTVGKQACGVAVPSISASPTRVQTGGTSTLTVSASGVDGTCTITGPGVSQTISSGTSCTVPSTTIPTGAITSLSTYTISCDSGEASAKVLVNVVPKIQEF